MLRNTLSQVHKLLRRKFSAENLQLIPLATAAPSLQPRLLSFCWYVLNFFLLPHFPRVNCAVGEANVASEEFMWNEIMWLQSETEQD